MIKNFLTLPRRWADAAVARQRQRFDNLRVMAAGRWKARVTPGAEPGQRLNREWAATGTPTSGEPMLSKLPLVYTRRTGLR